jgi:hypothetical protein
MHHSFIYIVPFSRLKSIKKRPPRVRLGPVVRRIPVMSPTHRNLPGLQDDTHNATLHLIHTSTLRPIEPTHLARSLVRSHVSFIVHCQARARNSPNHSRPRPRPRARGHEAKMVFAFGLAVAMLDRPGCGTGYTGYRIDHEIWNMDHRSYHAREFHHSPSLRVTLTSTSTSTS